MTRLSPEEVAARLTWLTVPGPELDHETRRLLGLGAGGLVLFRRNVRSVEQVARLCADARAAAAGPLRIAVDQEGGHILRLAEPLTRMPSLMAIGASGSIELAYRVARASARELRAVGVDTVFGPVLDLASEPASVVVGARAFGYDPVLVAQLGAAMVAGYRAGGVMAVGKHFPGHGRTPLDSHVDLPVVGGTVEQLVDEDLLPFRAAVRAGADVLMVGHCVYPAVDQAPATLSQRLLATLARRELDFHGVLLTDGLIMDAICGRFGMAEGARRSLLAGNDAILPLSQQRAALDAAAEVVASGGLGDRQVALRLLRLEALEARARSLAGDPVFDPAAAIAEFANEHAALVEEVAEKSLTLVGGARRRLRSDGPLQVVELGFDRPSPVEDETAGHEVAAVVRRHFPAAAVQTIRPAEMGAPDDRLSLYRGPVLLLTRDHARVPGLRGLAQALAARGPLVHVAMRSPHDLSASAGLGATRIAAYSDTPPTIAALLRRLTSAGEWSGTLPVPAWWTEPAESAEAVA